jgi:hypothetical protein
MGMSKFDPAPLARGFAGLVVAASLVLGLTSATSSNTRKQTSSLMRESNVPEPVRAVLQRACGNCHSDNTVWPWYARIPPISLRIHSDVANARAFMDLSKWNDYSEGERKGFTLAIGQSVDARIMPPPPYVWIHREARLSPDEVEIVKSWALSQQKPGTGTTE